MKIRQLLESPKINLSRLLLMFQSLLGDHFDDDVEIKTKIIRDDIIRFDVFFNQSNLKQWDTRKYYGSNIDHLEVIGEHKTFGGGNFYNFNIRLIFDVEDDSMIGKYHLTTENSEEISLYILNGVLGNGDNDRTFHSWNEAFMGFIDEMKYHLKTD